MSDTSELKRCPKYGLARLGERAVAALPASQSSKNSRGTIAGAPPPVRVAQGSERFWKYAPVTFPPADLRIVFPREH
jgi:hypothetical protein